MIWRIFFSVRENFSFFHYERVNFSVHVISNCAAINDSIRFIMQIDLTKKILKLRKISEYCTQCIVHCALHASQNNSKSKKLISRNLSVHDKWFHIILCCTVKSSFSGKDLYSFLIWHLSSRKKFLSVDSLPSHFMKQTY